MANEILVTRGLTKRYGNHLAVDHVELSIQKGQIYGLVGRNGAGKTTIIRMVTAQTVPTEGEVSLFGASGERELSKMRARTGAMVETPSFYPYLTARQNLEYYRIQRGIPGRRVVDEVLEEVDLAGTGKKTFKNFSLGMKQRLGLALALVGSPDLLLLDEPFNGMDPETTRDLRRALVRLNRDRGVTIVISSHVLDQLMRVCTRFGVIAGGHMVREFTDEELHAACGSSVRVKTADPARALAILEERLPGATFRVEPDQAIVVGGGARRATSAYGGASSDPAASGAPSVEDVSRVLHDAGQVVLELTVLERDIEDYFVELMDGGSRPAAPAPEGR